jgi:rubredoxin
MDMVFCNFSQLRVRGFQRRGEDGNELCVFAEGRDMCFLCLDKEKAGKLIALGIGACISLYNVRVTSTSYTITNQSGIRILQEEEKEKEKENEKDEIERCSQSKHSKKWSCLMCNFVYFESVSVCFSCNCERRAGPVGPDELFRHLKGPPYENKPWECPRCFARKNSPFRDFCWKCLKDRPKSKKRRVV